MPCFFKPLFLGLLLSLFIPVSGQADNMPIENQGEIGGGIFMPLGKEAQVASISPIVQLSAQVLFSRHFGFEAEFHYIPVQLENTVLAASAHRKATQMALLGGLRFVTSSLSKPASSLVAYVGARAGFARISVRSDGLANSGGWIGRPIDEIEHPFVDQQGNLVNTRQFITIKRQKGLALSPKTGIQWRVSPNAFFDIAFTPIFIFDRGDQTTQFFFTLSYGMVSQSIF